MALEKEETIFWQSGKDVFVGRGIKTSSGFKTLPGTERCVKTFASIEEANNKCDEMEKAIKRLNL
ncbi:MAG: hypothetical protein V1892_01855 [bacterium]